MAGERKGFCFTMQQEEIWKDIPDYEGLYQASNMGRIKRLSGWVRVRGGGLRMVGERILNLPTQRYGYLLVGLSKDGRQKMQIAHRVIAQTWIPNPNNYPQINHINGNKRDNRVENLEWCDNSMNQKHAYDTGLKSHADNSGRPKRRVKLTNVVSGESSSFDSVADAWRFLGGTFSHRTKLTRVLSDKYPKCKIAYGYYAEYL